MKKISLASSPENGLSAMPSMPEPGVYYPNVYISDLKSDTDLQVGQKVIIYGVVTEHTKRDSKSGKSSNFSIDCKELEAGAAPNKNNTRNEIDKNWDKVTSEDVKDKGADDATENG